MQTVLKTGALLAVALSLAVFPQYVSIAAPPQARAVRATSAIEVDGVFTESAWEQAQWYSEFLVASVPGDAEPLRMAQVQTRFKVVFDDNAVYVAVECDEPNIEKVKAETPWRDGAVWQDDCVEIFFDPSNEGRYYHQVMVNARGTTYDSYGADYGLVKSGLWNGAFRAAGKIDNEARKWRVEVEIPFGAIVLGENAGSTWRWNVTRERHAGGELELTSWAPLRRDFHQPRLFGTLSGLPDDYRPFRFEVREPKVDVSRAGSGVTTLAISLTVRNATGTDREVIATAAILGEETSAVKLDAIAVAHDAEATLEFPPLTFRGSAPSTNVVLALHEKTTGRLLKAVVKKVSSEYRPLTVRVLQPCYRNNIYATEKLKAVVFEVELSADLRQKVDTVRYALVDTQGKQRAGGQTTAGELHQPITLAMGDLPVGKYLLQVEAVGVNGKTEAEAEVTLRKLPPPPAGHEVRIDENRNVLVDGKPLFAIGWYGSVPTDDPRPDVVALQNVRTPLVVSPSDVSAIGRAYREHGIYSIVSVELGRLYYSFELWRPDKEHLRGIVNECETLSEPSDEVRRMARELIDAVRGEPGLLGYYIADEPEIHNVKSSYLESYYQYLCELDPYHPVFVTNDTIDGIVTHGYRCADVLAPDPYSPEWDYVPSFLKKVNEVAARGKATYVTLWHSSSQAHFVRDYGTAPPYPYRVFRNQYFASVAYGAKGFAAYTSPFFMNEIEYRYGLPYVWRELRFLERAILAPEPKQKVHAEGAPELATWAREVDGHVYLIAVHHKQGQVQARILWEPLKSRGSLYVMSEGREVKLHNGSFDDRFAEGDVHIYSDDPRAKDFPTTTAIEAELEKRHKDAVKPGNLLHWTHGTKVRCSAGYYAPWFHQFYYYAINGLTDDTGWSAYAWDKKSAWIELTLKQPAEIGRVVLYTPNIADYHVDFIAPGGDTRRFAVVGNEENVVTHNFKPPVPCLKLRVTVTGIRPVNVELGNGPLLSEIEAYSQAGDGPATPVELVQAEAAAVVKVLFADDTEPRALWEDNFTDFQTAPQYYWDARDTKWVLNAETFRAAAKPGGGVTVASMSPKGYDAMTHIFPYNPAYRFFQVKLASIEGEGYRFVDVGFSNPSGTPGYRGAVNTSRPGIYTVDTHYVHDNYRTGKDDRCFIRINAAGSRKNPDDSVTPGPEFTFDWIRLVRRPLDGLAVTLADGSPIRDKLREGDTLHFEVHLTQPAQDVVVEVLTGAGYDPLSINGKPYVQLHPADESGSVWVGEATLGSGTGKFECKGYPVVFRAVITGGAIDETWASAFVNFE